MDSLLPILVLIFVLGGLLSPLLRRRLRGSKGKSSNGPPISGPPQRKPYTLKASSTSGLPHETKISEDDFSYEDEYRAATARQRVWIQYKDKSGNITERKIEIYHPEDDDYVFAWCCARQEPRTFSRHNIYAWRLLPEHFEYDPMVEKFWREEGTRDHRDRLPWRRWIGFLSPELTAHYRQLSEQASSNDLSSPYSRKDTTTSPSGDGPRWWELRDKALIAYSKINSSSLSDYQEVIGLAMSAINTDASVSAQARLYRVIGEIYDHCGQTKDAIENLERAIKLDPAVGVKKLLARLKGSNA